MLSETQKEIWLTEVAATMLYKGEMKTLNDSIYAITIGKKFLRLHPLTKRFANNTIDLVMQKVKGQLKTMCKLKPENETVVKEIANILNIQL